MCITSEQLTEQWKKGELPESLYWVKYDGVINILDNLEISLTNVEQILGEVPSYEEWEQLQNWADFTNDYHELREKLEIAEYKNAQLKELLKECKELFVLEKGFMVKCIREETLSDIITKIGEVLK